MTTLFFTQLREPQSFLDKVICYYKVQSYLGEIMALSLLQKFKLAFRDFGVSLHKLFLQITGLLFAVFGLFLLLNGYQHLGDSEESGFKYYFIIAAFLLFGVLMLGFGIQSLYRLRSMK